MITHNCKVRVHQNEIQKKIKDTFKDVYNYKETLNSEERKDSYYIVNLPKYMPKMPNKTALRHLRYYPKNWPDFIKLKNDGTLSKHGNSKIKLIANTLAPKVYKISEQEEGRIERSMLELPKPEKTQKTTVSSKLPHPKTVQIDLLSGSTETISNTDIRSSTK